jgi:hypothetical protein
VIGRLLTVPHHESSVQFNRIYFGGTARACLSAEMPMFTVLSGTGHRLTFSLAQLGGTHRKMVEFIGSRAKRLSLAFLSAL